MTADAAGATECFVYLTLLGTTEPVTAGRLRLETGRRGDPVELRLSDERFETARMGGLFGALRDAGPDHWGRRVIEKHSGLAAPGELDNLLLVRRFDRERTAHGHRRARMLSAAACFMPLR